MAKSSAAYPKGAMSLACAVAKALIIKRCPRMPNNTSAIKIGASLILIGCQKNGTASDEKKEQKIET